MIEQEQQTNQHHHQSRCAHLQSCLQQAAPAPLLVSLDTAAAGCPSSTATKTLKLVRDLLLVAAGNASREPGGSWEDEEVRQMCNNYNLNLLSSADVAINLLFLSSKYSSYFLSEDLILEG